MIAVHEERTVEAERDALQAKIDAVRRVVAQLESEATYYVDKRVDVGAVTHRIRAALDGP